MADTFAVSFVACLLAAIVFVNGYSMWNSVKWKLRNKLFPVQYIEGVAPEDGGGLPDLAEITKMHEARGELDLVILDLKPNDPGSEQAMLKAAHVYRATISERHERRIRSMYEFQQTMRKSSAARTRIK